MTIYNTQWLIKSTRNLLALGTENPESRYDDEFVCTALNYAYKRFMDYVKRAGALKKYVPQTIEGYVVDQWVDLPDDVYGLVGFIDSRNKLIPNDQVMTGKDFNREMVLFRFNRDTLKWQYYFPKSIYERIGSDKNPLFDAELTMVYTQKIDELSPSEMTHVPMLFSMFSGFEELLLQAGAVYYLWNTESCVNDNNTKVQKFDAIFNTEMQRLTDAIATFRYDEGKIYVGK